MASSSGPASSSGCIWFGGSFLRLSARGVSMAQRFDHLLSLRVAPLPFPTTSSRTYSTATSTMRAHSLASSCAVVATSSRSGAARTPPVVARGGSLRAWRRASARRGGSTSGGADPCACVQRPAARVPWRRGARAGPRGPGGAGEWRWYRQAEGASGGGRRKLVERIRMGGYFGNFAPALISMRGPTIAFILVRRE